MMKKQSSTYSFLALMTAFVFVAGFSTASLAQTPQEDSQQGSHVDAALDELNAKEAQALTQIQPLQATVDQLKNESEKIKTLLKQNETQIAALKETSVVLTLKAFEELVLNNPQGKCKFTQSEGNPREFFIVKDDVKIRFVLAPEDSAKKPTVKKLLVNNINVIQYQQTGWSDKNPSAETFRAIIETNVKTSDRDQEHILRSTFNGERVDERFLGGLFGGALPAESPITCILNN